MRALKPAVYHRHRSRVVGAETQTVNQLRHEQHRHRTHAPADHEKAQHCGRETDEQDEREGIAPHQRRHQQEHHDFGDDAIGPHPAHCRLAVAVVHQIDRKERVQRSVRQRHQKARREQGHDFGPPQDGPHRPGLGLTSGGCRFGHKQRAGPAQRIGSEHHPQEARHRQRIQGIPDQHYRCDETDRAPNADHAVTADRPAQMRQRQRLEQRHRSAGEKSQREQQGEQTPERLCEKKAGEAQPAAGEREPYDAHALSVPIGDPAPEVRSHHPHQLPKREQHADLRRGESQRSEIQAEIRRGRADLSEVGEIESGQAPVGNCWGRGRGHDMNLERCIEAQKRILHGEPDVPTLLRDYALARTASRPSGSSIARG